MGIPSYFSYIVKNHPNIIKKLNKNNISINNLYLDCNSIIYDAVHNINFNLIKDSQFYTIIQFVLNKIDEYINLIKPNENILIAFDGVAPMAKLKQQRERRYKSWYQNEITNKIYNNLKSETWNTTHITPGTVFMSELNEAVKKYYNQPNKYNVNKIIVSTSGEYGEGEHKIFDYIRNNEYFHKSTNTIIYGLDADLIMLSINHLPISNNIYLFRETPHFIQSIDNSLEPNSNYFLDIPELAKIITLDMNNGEELSTEQQKNRIYDYIFLCFFLGNDFMPHFPAVNIRTGGVDKMLNAYKAVLGGTNENLTDGKIIYWKNVRKLVTFLSNQEEDFIKNEMKLRNKREKYTYPVDTPENIYKKFDAIPNYERELEKYINPFQSSWENRYYKSLLKIEYDDQRIKQISLNYIEGLEWTMKYYTSSCPDWRWYYKYNYPPLLKDLIKYIPYFENEIILYKQPNPIAPIVQLCYVVPKPSLKLLPSKIYDLLMLNYDHWYKTDCEFTWAFCKYFWESHVELPEIDINELEHFIKSNNYLLK
jgi:5'-3' exonuclease